MPAPQHLQITQAHLPSEGISGKRIDDVAQQLVDARAPNASHA